MRIITRRRIKIGLIVIVTAVTLWLGASFAVAYRLTRRAHPRFAEPVPNVAWGKFESHRLRTDDGQELGVWLVRGRDTAPSVVLLHGNGGSRKNCLGRAEMLAGEGCTVLLVSLRAHGDSSGDFNDIGFSARHDVVAAVDFLEKECPGRQVILHGTSLGAAAAIFAAEPLGQRAHGYILECPYGDLKTAVRNRMNNYLPPLLDWVAYQGMVTVAPIVLPNFEKISPSSAISSIPRGVPVLILAGGADRRARLAESMALFEGVQSHGRLEVFKDADHLGLEAAEPERYRQTVLGFVRGVGN